MKYLRGRPCILVDIEMFSSGMLGRHLASYLSPLRKRAALQVRMKTAASRKQAKLFAAAKKSFARMKEQKHRELELRKEGFNMEVLLDVPYMGDPDCVQCTCSYVRDGCAMDQVEIYRSFRFCVKTPTLDARYTKELDSDATLVNGIKWIRFGMDEEFARILCAHKSGFVFAFVRGTRQVVVLPCVSINGVQMK